MRRKIMRRPVDFLVEDGGSLSSLPGTFPKSGVPEALISITGLPVLRHLLLHRWPIPAYPVVSLSFDSRRFQLAPRSGRGICIRHILADDTNAPTGKDISGIQSIRRNRRYRRPQSTVKKCRQHRIGYIDAIK